MVDTGRVGNDKRRAIICLCLTDSLQSLGIVCAHCHLSYIYISVGGSYKAEVLLADALAGRSKLSDSCDRSRLGRLTAGVRVNLCVKHKDIYIVQTAETDVVACAVATDDPLATLNKIILQSDDLLAAITSCLSPLPGFLHKGVTFFARCIGIVAGFHPCSGGSLERFRSVGTLSHLVASFFKTSAHLLICYVHAETELAEVFKE